MLLAERKHSDGFTLIEMSIVLVVIGLIVGGVLVGQDLIRASYVRAQITQIEKYQTAANTFYGKYQALPGDMNATTAMRFSGFAPRGLYPGQGDGNGILEGSVQNGPGFNIPFIVTGGETAMFWADLSVAQLIEGGFSTATSTDIPVTSLRGVTTAISLFLPPAVLGNGNYVYVYSGCAGTYCSMSSGINYYGISSISVLAGNYYTIYSTPGMTVQQAYRIDSKIDDGMPQSGRVTARYITGNVQYGDNPWQGNLNAFNDLWVGVEPGNADVPTRVNCYDNGGNASNPMVYTLSNANQLNCALSFQFQAGD